jgi:hypothetical protein
VTPLADSRALIVKKAEETFVQDRAAKVTAELVLDLLGFAQARTMGEVVVRVKNSVTKILK